MRTTILYRKQSMESWMCKPFLVSAAVLAAFGATTASAMPMTSPVGPTSNVEQVRLVCNEWGRCWRQPDYHRPYGYYRYRYGDDDWRERYRYRDGYGYYGRHYRDGYEDWGRGRERDDD
jgi:hypothetical protein